MTTISHVVKEILNRQIFLQEAINNNIVSYNRLADHLKPKIEAELGHEVKHPAIVMALRRHAEKTKTLHEQPRFNYIVETIKTDICYIALEESPDLLDKIQTLYTIIDFKKGGLLNIIQGNFELALITNRRYKEELLQLLHDEKIIQIVDDLVSISLTYSKHFLFVPGVIYEVIRILTWENINIIEIILTTTEMSIIISKNDLMRCYDILGNFGDGTAKDVRIKQNIIEKHKKVNSDLKKR
ncbi:MAG: hypothetical protein QXX20_02910 [Candidatus Thermoplasmatota archaeon]